jgi:PII-like signaling protein
MEHLLLKFYVHESDRYNGRQVWEWLLEQGNRLQIEGGSAFRAVGGFGRHHRVREERFVELAGTVAVAVEFVLSSVQADQLLAAIAQEGLQLPFIRCVVEFGVTGTR